MDISTELDIIQNSKKGSQIKQAIYDALKKIEKEVNHEVTIITEEREYNITRPIDMVNYSFDTQIVLPHTPIDILDYTAYGFDVNPPQDKTEFTVQINGDNHIVLHSNNGRYFGVYIKIRYTYAEEE